MMNEICEWLSSRTGESCVYCVSIAEGVVSMSAMTAGCVIDFKRFSWGLLPFCVTTIRVFLLLLQSSRSPLLTEEFCVIMMGASSVWLAIVYMYIMAQNPAQGAISDYVYAFSAVLVSANMGILFLSTSVMVAVTKARQREEEGSNRRIAAAQAQAADKPAFGQEELEHMTLRCFRYGDPSIDMNTIDAVCIICLLAYQDGELVRQLRCGHHFHNDCIATWLKRTTSARTLCPMRCPPLGLPGHGSTDNQAAPQHGESREQTPSTPRRRSGTRVAHPLGEDGFSPLVPASGQSAPAEILMAAPSSRPLPERLGLPIEDLGTTGQEEWVIDVDEAFEQVHPDRQVRSDRFGGNRCGDVVLEQELDSEASILWEL